MGCAMRTAGREASPARGAPVLGCPRARRFCLRLFLDMASSIPARREAQPYTPLQPGAGWRGRDADGGLTAAALRRAEAREVANGGLVALVLRYRLLRQVDRS